MPVIPQTNCAMIVNNASAEIVIDRDPNFDDMILVIDGERQWGNYKLPSGAFAFVGATYSDEGPFTCDTDMGLSLTYKHNDRYMEIGIPPDGGQSSANLFQVVSDGEDGDDSSPLIYTVTDQSATSITLTFSDRS